MMNKIVETLSLGQLHAIYTVYRDLDPNTRTINCCTCGKTLVIESFEDCYSLLGHYIPRSISRKLIYHPLNAHPQCPSCNVFTNSIKHIDDKYDAYMKYRYGDDIKIKLIDEDAKSLEYYEDFYKQKLKKLAEKFPELQILFDVEIARNNNKINSIQEQFESFSVTYKQDLDILTKALGTDPINYERLLT